ncbi:MAG: hypothetical protein ABL940_02235 [Bacteroidia bacterium]
MNPGENYIQRIINSGNTVPKSFEYWRKGTEYELKFGFGDILYRDFDLADCINEDGSFRLALIAENDGLKYYSRNFEYSFTRKYKILKTKK